MYDVRTRLTMKHTRRPVKLVQEDPEEVNNFSIGKNRAVKKAARVERKNTRVALRTEKKQARNANLRSKAESRVILANQGITQQSDAGQIFAGLGQAVGGIAGAMSGGGGIAGILGGGNGQGGNSIDAMPQMATNGNTLASPANPVAITPGQLAPSSISGEKWTDEQAAEQLQNTGEDLAPTPGDGLTPGKKDNTMMFIIIGVIVIVFFFLRKK